MSEKDYKKLLKDKLIQYRNCLNLPSDVTFGVEIEYENIPTDTVTWLIYQERQLNENLNKWFSKREPDLSEYNNIILKNMNGEISSPILMDNINAWNDLKIILNMLEKNSAIVTSKCGGHINIGAHILGNNQEYWKNFLLLWTLYYKEICKFSSGEFINLRKRRKGVLDNSYILLSKQAEFIFGKYGNIGSFLIDNCDFLFSSKYDISIPIPGILSDSIKEENRIEFRLPNATLKEEIWQNYINFFAKFVLACRKELDAEKILYKIKNKESSAVELANYVFDDDIDKEYFLIQTLKTNKIYKKELPEHKIYY